MNDPENSELLISSFPKFLWALLQMSKEVYQSASQSKIVNSVQARDFVDGHFQAYRMLHLLLNIGEHCFKLVNKTETQVDEESKASS